MESFPTAMILANRAARREILSARPDAPVVPDRPRHPARLARPVRRLRAELARGLERLAGAVAPTPTTPHRA